MNKDIQNEGDEQMKVQAYLYIRLSFWALLLVAFSMPCYVLAQTTYKVTAQKVNVRNKPSTQALVVGTLNKDDVISVNEVNNGWASFTFKGNIRYVSATYIEQVGRAQHKALPKAPVQPKLSDIAEPSSTPSNDNGLKKPTKSRDQTSSKGQLSILADVFGGYSNFRCVEVSPKPGFGFGADIGVQCDYAKLWGKIPIGLFAEVALGYSCRGSGAYPLHCIGARILPIGYRYYLNSDLALVGKMGLYLAYPFSNIATRRYTYSGSFDCGLSLGLGADWKQFGFMISYEHGFMNVIDGGSVSLLNQGAYLTISYKFLNFK